jgi:[protein-PII] uridylyltransferase
MPRRLRHFTSKPRIRFSKDPDRAGTVLRLECNDQPGLLSRIASAIFKQGIQVHNARIATFGERVEDTFLISDSRHRPLTRKAQNALSQTLSEYLETE